MKQSFWIKTAVCSLLFFAVAAFAQMSQPFSADFTSTTSQNNVKVTGKMYFSAPKMRMDVTMPQNERQNPMGGNVSMIVDGTTQTSYMLMPQQQMYMEFHGREAGMNPGMRSLARLRAGADPCADQPDKTCRKVGTETVNGRSCDKWEVTNKNSSNKETYWVDQKLYFPIKMQTSSGDVTEFTNIKEGAQPASLFTVPAGYRPFDPSAFGGQRRPK